MSAEHWMMFGTFAEQRHFVYPSKETYDGVLINANMAAHAPDGLAAFLLEKTNNLRYIIDPLTHAFQHDPLFIKNNGTVRSSIDTLSKEYGKPISSAVVEDRRLFPKDFSDDTLLKEFVDRCLQFQKDRLSLSMTKIDANKYLGQSAEDCKPYALIAPYFYMTETTIDQWLPVCVKVAKMAREFHKHDKIFASIVVSQGVILNNKEIDKIINGFNDLDVNGFLLWIDDFNEHTVGSTELRSLVRLARGLRKGPKREVINLHGGYFSILAAGTLGNSAMSGVAHGPEFGEHRSVVPVGGGIPIARYYIPDLHARVKYRDAVAVFQKKGWLKSAKIFHEQVCNCQECKNTINGSINNFVLFGEATFTNVRRGDGIVRMEFPTGKTKLRCLQHYLERKAIEYRDASEKTKEELIEGLRSGRSKYEDALGLESIAHLELWEKVLTED